MTGKAKQFPKKSKQNIKKFQQILWKARQFPKKSRQNNGLENVICWNYER